MSRNLKFWLPAGQMAFAIALLWFSADRQLELIRTVHGSVGPVLTFRILWSMNAPAAILARHLTVVAFFPNWLGYIEFVAFVGILWWWVAQSVSSWKQRKAVFNFEFFPLRVLLDFCLIALGILLALVFVAELESRGTRYAFGLAAMAVELPTLLWSGLLMPLFARDLFMALNQG